MTRQIIKTGLVFLLLLLLIAGAMVFFVWVEKRHWEEAEEAKSVEILANVKAPEKFADEVIGLGVFLRLQDGSWIVIRYKDVHVLPIRSSAVGLDSEGNWFHSNQHFCGKFMHYRTQKERFAEIAKPFGEKETNDAVHLDEDLLAIEKAEHLDVAHQILKKMGFSLFFP